MARKPTYITPQAAKTFQAPLDKNIVDLEELIATSPGGKAAERAYLESIQPEIDKVAKASAERRKLEATPEQKKRVAAEAKGRKEQEQRRLTERQQAISAALAKQKDKPKNETPDNRPTPERARRLAGVAEIAPPIGTGDQRTATKAHVAQGVVEFYQSKWTYEELEGARYLVNAWHSAAVGQQKVTANYDGTPGNAFGPRAGGVRGAEKTVDAHHLIFKIEAVLHQHFGANGLNLIRWFAWETVRVAQEGATMGDQMVEAGRRLAPFVKDKERLWGVTFGSLQRIFHFVHGHWVVPAAMERDRSSKQGDYRARLNAKGYGAEQLAKIVDEEIASTPKGLHVIKGGK